MARFPRIDAPCPLRFSSMPEAGRDYCGACERSVHNLDAMGEAERVEWLSAQKGKVCVAYSLPRRRSMAHAAMGMGLAAAMAATPVAAQDNDCGIAPGSQSPTMSGEPQPYCESDDELDTITVIGGTLDPASSRWIEDDASGLQSIPEVGAESFLSEDAPNHFRPTPTAKGG